MEISLTDFVEFTLKTGSTRLTKVRQIKGRPKYHPAHDYWKILRDKIEEFHSKDEDDLLLFDDLLQSIDNKSKGDNYKLAIDRYKEFIKKKNYGWFQPPYSLWKNNELSVRINPEIGLLINDEKFAIKLYFGSEKISKSKISLILSLLKIELAENDDIVRVGLLDIKNKKLHTDQGLAHRKLLPLLIGEAFAFEHIWNNI